MSDDITPTPPPDAPPPGDVTPPPDGPAGPGGPMHHLVARGTLVAYILVIVAVLVAVNVVSSQHSRSWDLTKNQRYSLSAESVQILHGLKQPLKLIYFDRSSNFAQAKQLLSEYQRESNKVSVEYVDPDRHPDEARAYQIQNYGTTVVDTEGRRQTVTNLTEQDLTNAIVRTLKGARKVAYFVEGEGERDPNDSGRNGYSDLKTALESENFTVQTLVLAQTPKVPADCNVLVVAGPDHPMSQPEIDAISQYINGGGRAIFLVNYETTGPLIDYLQTALDVNLTPDDVVVDTSGVGRLFGASEVMPIAATYESHPITAEMHDEATLFPYARTVDPGSVSGSKATVQALVETSQASFAATKFNGNTIDTTGARQGPLSLAVAGTLPTTATSGDQAGDSAEARYVVIGSPDFVSNAVLGFNGNQDFFLNAMNWLSAQENFITVRPKPPENSPVNLSGAQMTTMFWLLLVGLPVAIAIFGVSVWWRRRAA